MSRESFDPDRHGIDGGVGKLVTINHCPYRLSELFQKGERETEYKAVNLNTGLTRFVIKVYVPGLSEQQVKEDADQRLVAFLTLRALGLPVIPEDVVQGSCGPVRLQRTSFEPDVGDRCAPLLQHAHAAYERSDFQTAIETCEAIAELNPNHTDAMAIHALCRVALSDPSGALTIMSQVLELEPNDTQLTQLAADCADALGLSHVAIRLLSAEIERAPARILAAERLVQLLLDRLRVEDAEEIVRRYRGRLSPEAGAAYFAAYDAGIERARERVAQIGNLIALQDRNDWQGARNGWESLARADDRIARLNLEICRYHLNEACDLGGLVEIAMKGNPVVRAISTTLLLLAAARADARSIAVATARAVRRVLADPAGLCGLPIWCLWDRHASASAEPVIAVLRGLVASSPPGDERELFRWVMQHYETYAEYAERPRRRSGE